MNPSADSPEPRERLLRWACAELDRRLRAGEEARAEEWLARFPELAADADAAVELIYAEFTAAEERGRRPDEAAYLARFPRWRTELDHQFRIHRLLREGEAAPTSVTSAAPSPTGTAPGATAGPQSLGPFELLELIGTGSAGRVYKARQRDIDRLVAVKVFDASRQGGPAVREAEAAARLDHPGLVRLLQFGEADGRPYLVMELVAGGRLADRLRGGPLAPAAAAELAERMARAVAYAHSKGVVHRDLTPANVLLAEEPADGKSALLPKIADFGLSSRLRSADGGALPAIDGEAETDGLAGTPSYMAPEQVRGRAADIGPAADVYGLGAVLYEMLTGRPPFRADTPLHTLQQVLAADPVPPERLQPGVPADLSVICLKCLHKDPNRRYAGADALADDLRRFLAGEPILARPAGPVERLVKWSRRHPLTAALTAALAAAMATLLVGGAWYAVRLREALDHARQGWARVDEEAEALRKRVEAARRDLYTIQIRQVEELWQADPGRALELLDDPAACPEDLRDFAWRMYHRLCKRHRLVVPIGRADARSVAFSPDGKTITVRFDGASGAWDAESGAASPAAEIATPTPAPTPAVTIEGGLVRIGGADGTGTRTVAFAEAPTKLSCAALSPDGALVAAAYGGTPARVQVREAAGGALRLSVPNAHVQPVRMLAFSPDGRRLASGSADRAVKVWTIDGPSEPLELRGHLGGVRAVVFSPDGRRLASAAEDAALRVWSTSAPPPDRTIGNASRITCVAAAPDGSLVAAACEDGTVKIWPADTLADPVVINAHAVRALTVAFSPDGRTVATGGEDGAVRLWTPAGRRIADCPSSAGRVRALSFAPDGRRLAAAAEDGKARVWTLSADRPPPAPIELAAKRGSVRALSFHLDGRRLAVGNDDGTVCLWDVGSPSAPPRTLNVGFTRGLLIVAFGPDGKTLATGGQDYAVRLWDADTLSPCGTLAGHTEFVIAASFSPDGRLLATGSGSRFADVPGEVHLWSVSEVRPRTSLPRQTGPLAFSADGRLLASVEDFVRVRLWRADGP